MASQDFYTDIDLFKVSQLLNTRIHNVTTVERTALAALLGAANKGLFVWDTDLNVVFYWDGTSWISGVVPVTPPIWGNITGTLSNQTDLQIVLDNKADYNALSVIAFTGNYSNLIGIPSFATVATSGNYNDLINLPIFGNVAFSGSYTDLVNTPVLASVAVSGDYNDLTNTPILPPATVPSGSNTQVQYNSSGVFGASADFTWNNSLKFLNINGNLFINNIADFQKTGASNNSSIFRLLGGSDNTESGSFYFDGPDTNNAAYGAFGISTFGGYFGITGAVLFSSSAIGTGIQKPMVFGGYRSGWTTWLKLNTNGIINIGNTPDLVDNVAALGVGLVAGDIYRTGDLLKIVH